MSNTEYSAGGKIQAMDGYRKGDLYRIVGLGGKVRALFGTEGVIAWIGATGNPKAWDSSPDRFRVARVGLRVAGQTSFVFVDVAHVVRIDRPMTVEDQIMMDAVIGAFATLSA